jgi:hypothetical protein
MVSEPQPSASNQNNNKNTPICNIVVLETEKNHSDGDLLNLGSPTTIKRLTINTKQKSNKTRDC